MKKLIKKILREEINKSDRHYRTLDTISKYVELPYFKSMEGLTIYEKDDQEYIMRKLLGNISIELRNIRKYILDDKGNEIYREDSDGDWGKYEYDDNDNTIYEEYSDGFWKKKEYDDKGNQIYYENSYGEWEKYEYDDKGNEIYQEHSYGYWLKSEYDEDGNEIDYDEGWIP
jgi:hypothetical protein